ncbi:hypothetical protein FPF71_00260 [Algibacter amylolyticus]|uniref:Lysoplasmalogenase n=1 Tax=Algibacter amylolyticus TaxID=1608400 RepID=A0A5M7BC47_9FLAO|nr:lysoplasmalogenase family protein [Algibacter amylolyticus]KAA5827313.1 hypothetical protein F2B50_00260 [Algibacter amylolyticus]MBB5266496.1 hypothetical protein [Algibacter amylolyticus]TSJ81558.1 hypothetical protein FPF71_00260 [Algibacter amylolyticus]
MVVIFRNNYIFAILFFTVLVTDIYIKINFGASTYRLISKAILSILLLAYYLLNEKEISSVKRVFVISALMFFMLGDIMLIFNEIHIYNMVGICSFIVAKMFYVFRFYNSIDFSFKKLIPILILCFVYMSGILILINQNMNSNYYLIILLYLFIALGTLIFAILRKPDVNKKSYYLVLIGVLFSVLSDSIAGLKLFYRSDIAYEGVTVMLFYGISQYLIISGLISQTKDFIELDTDDVMEKV